MAASGQGALVNVCDGKAPPSASRVDPGRAAFPTVGQDGAIWTQEASGAGAASETIMPEGETEAQRGEGPRLRSHSEFVAWSVHMWGRRQTGGSGRGLAHYTGDLQAPGAS